MTGRIASAPGKLVVAGEYSVLEGHPALVAAVDRRATATLRVPERGRPEKASAGLGRLEVAGLGKGPFVVEDTGTGVRLLGDDADELRLARAVLDEVVKGGTALPSGRITLDSTALNLLGGDEKPLKLGLGSSAAVACSLVACLAAEAGDTHVASDPFPTAFRAHLAFSLGRGSGIDVAAAARGGIVEFRRTDDGPSLKDAPRLPSELAVVIAFTGHAQDTRTFLDEVRGLKERDRAAYDDVLGAQAEACAALLDALKRTDVDAVITAARASHDAMRRLGEAAGIDIVSAPHRRMAEVAARFGGSAKPSGAGGGDVGLCFVPLDARSRLEKDLHAAGLLPLKLSLGAPGARTEILRG